MAWFFKWFFFLSKRLYKNAAFIIIVLLIPLSALAFELSAKKPVGFVSIAIVNEAKGGIGEEIIETLKADSVVTSVIEYGDEKTAVEDLNAGKIDTVWVLPADIEERIEKYVKYPGKDNYLARVIITEENVKIRLVRKKLFGAVFPYVSRSFYLNRVKNSEEFDLSDISDAKALRYYDNFFSGGELFDFAPPGGSTVRENEKNILVSPIRGLLSAVVMLCGFAGAMLFIRDNKNGVFSRAKSSSRVLISFASQFTAVLNISVFVFVAVFALGVNTAVWREAVILLIFSINASLFCTLLGQIIKNLNVYACAATFLTIAQMAICPIFFGFQFQYYPQLLFPNTYYINSVHNNAYLVYSLIYCAVQSAMFCILYMKKRRQV
ncbi:MAG: ABC transporter permease [Clostridia bacterium]|nr:ABC transporter permease [Clostridia bacterium]